MASSNAPAWSPREAQEYAAAESMGMLQHSGSGPSSSNGFASVPDSQDYVLETTQSQIPALPMQYPDFRPPFQPSNAQDQASKVNSPLGGELPPLHNVQASFDQQGRQSHSERSQGRTSNESPHDHRASHGSIERNGQANSMDGSEPISPASVRALNGRRLDESASWTHRLSSDAAGKSGTKGEVEEKPAWRELKTKAGKDRKRLPLACIACRRKKIRCSGEKPACKNCQRSRIPCVYKVTARKAAPRTDYMAMLDRRLKRMEERVIRIIPKQEMAEATAIPRAITKPLTASQAQSGRKRAAAEAFGSQLGEWAESKSQAQPLKSRRTDENKFSSEGAEHLPSAEIQEHLSEVFFDCLYGQSYHLMHKPSYMRRLHAGTLPPVLLLAVCAVSARFSTHPQINSEPAFLRGESWAGPARDIALKRYDEPNITILTVLLLLGLHEFGTCQGGRSWMFAGMATRMAYALQLHRELDHDPLGSKNGKKSELSFTDREIRRRTMWACFLMDRFTSSGTERPMFEHEETIKVQLPIKEAQFQMELPGPTESLDGSVPNPVTTDTGQLTDPKDNMGVAAYMIRIIALWGRVIEYLNMGGKEKDTYALWDPKSRFAGLKRQAEEFKTMLPHDLQNTRENLHSHAADRLANQFLFMHIVSDQVVLFLHRFAIPMTPGGRPPKDMPKTFLAEAVPAAVEAANRISVLLTDALDHHVVAPFIGYCAFVSSTVHVWCMFSNNPSIAATSKQNLENNVRYLTKMKKYWGMHHFMAQNLREIYRQHADASQKGNTNKSLTQDATIFQYGDWFNRYPHGLSHTDYEDSAAHKIKKEPADDAALSQKSDLQSVEEFFHTLSPTGRSTQHRKLAKKITKNPSQTSSHQPQPQLQSQPPDMHMGHGRQPIMPITIPETCPPMDPSSFTPTNPQNPPPLYHQSYPSPGDMLPLSAPANTALLPQLDRHLVYGAYAGNDPTASSSASALNALANNPSLFSHGQDPGSTAAMWDGTMDIQLQQQVQQQATGMGGYMGDLQTSAWFMPFNLNPPAIGGEGDEFGRLGGFGGGSG